jgi:hypothetical protein
MNRVGLGITASAACEALGQATPCLVFFREAGWIGRDGRADADSADFTQLCWRGDLLRLN